MNYKPKKSWSDAYSLMMVEDYVQGILKDLEVVSQTHQITDNQLMTDTLVLMLPYKYREKLIDAKVENEKLPAARKKSTWDLVWDYIKETKASLEANAPWLTGSIASDITDQFDKKESNEGERKFCQNFRYMTQK